MKQNPLPSIGDLFKESWEAFKKSVFYLIAFYVLAVIASIVVYGVFFLIFMLLGAGSLAALPELQKGGAGLIGIIGAFSILTPVFIIVAIVIGSAIQAGMILIANKYKKEIVFGEVLKQSLHLAIPLFLVNLLFFIIIFGGFFVFIIPAFAFALLFAFASYEVVLGSQRWTNALRNSMGIVMSNLGEILVRLLLIWGMIIGFSILRSMIEIPLVLLAGDSGTILSIILSFLFLPIQIALSIFSIYYMMALYNQAKQAMDPNKKPSLKWVWVITGIGWVIGVVVLISVMALIMNLSKSGEFNKIGESFMKDGKKPKAITNFSLSQSEADTLAFDVFDAVNKYRRGKGLQELKEDPKLCAYAQRRLEDLSILGRYDDGRGFYEDMASQAVINAYFTEYKDNGEAYFPLMVNGQPSVSDAKDANMIVNIWAGDGSEKRTINVKTDNFGCARADTKSLILIVGTHR